MLIHIDTWLEWLCRRLIIPWMGSASRHSPSLGSDFLQLIKSGVDLVCGTYVYAYCKSCASEGTIQDGQLPYR